MKIARVRFASRIRNHIHSGELVTGRYFNWYCKSEKETDRDAQKYHKLLLRAGTGEFSQQGYLTREYKRRRTMRVMVKCGAGIDVHKKNVVVNCRRIENKEVETETRTYGTTTPELLEMTDWLASWAVTDVAMESTGVYWHPVYNLLEGTYKVMVVNAKHIKHVPGRKTDVKDAEWIAELLSYGLLKASFVPDKPQRDMRDLTRYRTKLVQERAREVNRVQKVLKGANIKLASVATDILGVSGRLMLEALIKGDADEKEMAELAKGRMRSKIPEWAKALTGIVSDHHRFMLGEQLVHIDFLDEQITNSSCGAAQKGKLCVSFVPAFGG